LFTASPTLKATATRAVSESDERERGPDLILRQRPVVEKIEVNGAAVSEMK